VQYTAKGTVDGGFVNKNRMRMTLREAYNATKADLADMNALVQALEGELAAADRLCTEAENTKVKLDKERRRAEAKGVNAAAERQTLADKVHICCIAFLHIL
jgi:hypothetical protein